MYFVVPPEVWAGLPRRGELPCGRVRFAMQRVDLPPGSMAYEVKAEAVRDVMSRMQWHLIREVHYPPRWSYQLLIGVSQL